MKTSPEGLPYPQTPMQSPRESQQEGTDLTSEVSNLNRRMRVLEERYNNLNKKIQVGEQNVLSTNRDLSKSIKAGESEVVEVKRYLEDLREKMKLIVLELKECAKQDEVSVLKKYVDLWELVNFATSKEVERIVEEKLSQQKI